VDQGSQCPRRNRCRPCYSQVPVSSTDVMFDREESTPSHSRSLRPKRSRQVGSDEAIRPSQAKRRRSALRVDTFEPLSDRSPNEVVAVIEEEAATNGHAPDGNSALDGDSTATRDLTIRTAKSAERRKERGQTAMTLVSCPRPCELTVSSR
jgi:hypothetical protein